MDVFNALTKKLIDISKNKSVDEECIKVWQFLFSIIKNDLISIPTTLPKFDKNGTNIILTMTSCKRLNLFKQTVNSILHTWNDIQLVDKWIVVDDNSSSEDRSEMINTYPFIEYIMKNESEKGHLQSMNKIYDILHSNNSAYWIHIEDDFLFFYPMNYVSVGISGLSALDNFNVKQIMFNRNYIETFDQINMSGNIPYSDNTYALHDHKLLGTACKYWPNFSFRPSIIDTNAIFALGNFTSPNTFFEKDYAERYTNAGYKTAFFNSITNLHIGKLCNKQGENAYVLNRISQFGNNTQDYKIKVINLKRRADRLEKITKLLDGESLQYDIYEAVDGKSLTYTPEIDKLFKNNDFHSRRGFIGCALSHYYLWKELVNSNDPYYIIIEDDAKFCSNFKNKLEKIKDKLPSNDIIFLGYLKSKEDTEKYKSKYNTESDDMLIDKLSTSLYIGGTHCYSITKEGASGLIDFIEMYGIRHGIDYLITKVQKIIPTYETIPHLSFAEWTNTTNDIIDSDIQYDYSRLIEDEEQRPDNICSDYTNNTIKKLCTKDDFIFIEKLDQIGYDICSGDKYMSIDNYINKANELDNCVAFNTMGFFKEKITTLTQSAYFSNSDGIYINKDYYFNVFKKK